MRLLVRTIWRAFPELDPYTDAECATFVRRATRRAPRRWLHGVAVLLFFLAALAGSVVAAGFVLRFVEVSVPEALHDVVALLAVPVALALVFAVPSVGALILRDVFLRHRLAQVLRDRGSCGNCGYSLVGLPIPASLVVACPECGHAGPVDEALTVLVRASQPPGDRPEASGGIRVVGGDGWTVMTRPPRWPPERRRRWLKRGALATLGVVLVLGVTGGAYELWVRMQVAEARDGQPTAQEVTAVIANRRPQHARVLEPQGVKAILEIAERMEALETRVRSESDHLRSTWPEWGLVLAPVSETSSMPVRSPAEEERAALGRALAERLLHASEEDGLFDAFAGVRGAPREVRDLAYPPSTLAQVSLKYLGAAWLQASANAARMRVAIAAGNTATAAEALLTIRALARVCGDQPCLVEQRVSASIDGIAARDTLRWLASTPSLQELEIMQRAWTPEDPEALAQREALGVDMERILILAAVAEILADPTAVRLAPFMGITVENIGSRPPLRVRTPGSWRANRDAILASHAWLMARLPLERWERDASATLPPAPAFQGAELAKVFGGVNGMARFLESVDTRRLNARVVGTVIAIERWRATHRAYPATLDALVPALLPRVPTDPFTGKPMGYARVDPAADALGRGFLLVSPGPAGTPIVFNDAGTIPGRRTARDATVEPEPRARPADAPPPEPLPVPPVQRPPTGP
jgi:hypothetical protein